MKGLVKEDMEDILKGVSKEEYTRLINDKLDEIDVDNMFDDFVKKIIHRLDSEVNVFSRPNYNNIISVIIERIKKNVKEWEK